MKDNTIVLQRWVAFYAAHRLVVLKTGALRVQYRESGEWADGHASYTNCEKVCLPVFK